MEMGIGEMVMRMEIGRYKPVSLFLIVVLVSTIFLSGCDEDRREDNTGLKFAKDKIFEETINAEETREIDFGDGKVVIPFGAFEGNQTITISKLTEFPSPVDAEIIKAYSVEIGDIHKLMGFIEIRLKNDGNNDNLVALTYNESSQEWESILYHLEGEEVVIYTNHLSHFALASVEESVAKPNAKIKYVRWPSISIDENTAIKVLEEYIDNNYQPGPNAYRVGWDAAVEALGVESQYLTIAQHGYGIQSVERINNWIAYTGVGITVAQLMIDLNSGDTTGAGLNFMKNAIYNYVSLYGSPLLQLTFVGVFCIDYSITKFQSEILSTEEEIWKKLQNAYYRKYGRSAKDWYYIFYEICKDSTNAIEAKEKIDKEIDRYVNEFWDFVNGKDKNGYSYEDLVMDVYGKKLKEKGEASILEQIPHVNVKMKLKENHKAELIYSLQPVFYKLSKDLTLEQEEKVFQTLKKIAKELNKEYKIKVKVNGPSNVISGLKVYIPVARNQGLWTWETNENGECYITLTMYGYAKAQAANKIVLVLNNGETMEKEFKITSRTTEVTFDLGGSLDVSVEPKQVSIGDTFTVTVKIDPPTSTELHIKMYNPSTGYGSRSEPTVVKTDENGIWKGIFKVPAKDIDKKVGENVVEAYAPELDSKGSDTFVIEKPEISVTASPSTVTPGEKVVIKAKVSPPGVYNARLTVMNANSGASKTFEKKTDSNGNLVFRLSVTEKNLESKLGKNVVTVDIPELGIYGSADFYIESGEVVPTETPAVTPEIPQCSENEELTYIEGIGWFCVPLETTITPTPTPTETPSESPFDPNKKYRAGYIFRIELVDGRIYDAPFNTMDYGDRISGGGTYHVKYTNDIMWAIQYAELTITFDENYRITSLHSWYKLVDKEGRLREETTLSCSDLKLEPPVIGEKYPDHVGYGGGGDAVSSCVLTTTESELQMKRPVQLYIQFDKIGE